MDEDLKADLEAWTKWNAKEKPIVVKCQGCGAKVIWTGLYGDWCPVCKPRG